MIDPNTTHIQTERPQRRTSYPSDQPLADVCVWTNGSDPTNFGPVAQDSYSMRYLKELNITFLSWQPNFIQLHRKRSQSFVMPFGWCLQHHSTCPFMSLAVFTNSQSSLTLLNSASNLLSPNAVRIIWSSIAAYLIWPNCPSTGSLATAKYVPMRSRTC